MEEIPKMIQEISDKVEPFGSVEVCWLEEIGAWRIDLSTRKGLFKCKQYLSSNVLVNYEDVTEDVNWKTFRVQDIAQGLVNQLGEGFVSFLKYDKERQ